MTSTIFCHPVKAFTFLENLKREKRKRKEKEKRKKKKEKRKKKKEKKRRKKKEKEKRKKKENFKRDNFGTKIMKLFQILMRTFNF